MSKACYNRLVRLGNGNASVLADYLLSYKRESDTKDSTRATNCLNLVRFAEKINKPLRDTTREDVLNYFDGLRKPNQEQNKWKGTWKLHLVHIPYFFNKNISCPSLPGDVINDINLDPSLSSKGEELKQL